MTHFNLLTLFPDMFPGFLGQSLAGKALEAGKWGLSTHNIRDHATDTHKTVDDTPYGGGAGMVMRPDIIEASLLSIPKSARGRLLYPSPRGRVFDQGLAQELADTSHITMLCGRYEGVDQRVLDAYEFEEVSLGDFILSGGEVAALAMMDAIIRLIPGVMGNNQTSIEESFTDGLLEYPHYTRPAEWQDAKGNTHTIPDVLTSGHHENIRQWREDQSKELTKKRRPDLLPTSRE